jgi:pimeloyl-ACP methyl ester carboxylesterase
MNHFQKILRALFLISGTVILLTSCEHRPQAEVKKAKVGDIEIAYYMRGSGPPLVMVMGFRGTMAIWDPGLLGALEKHFTLILFDNRGVGLSSDTKEDHTTISQMAEDTARLIQALGFQKVHVLGWSMGSRIAQELAINYPDVVDKLILCSPNPGGEHQVPRKSDAYAQLTSLHLSKEEALSLIYPETSQGRSASQSFVKRLTDAIVNRTVPDDLTISQQAIERQIHALDLWDKSNAHYEALPRIRASTLVAGGLDDLLDQPENAHIVACRIPFAWAAYFPGAGHDFLSQDYTRFAKLIVLFIESEKKHPKSTD